MCTGRWWAKCCGEEKNGNGNGYGYGYGYVRGTSAVVRDRLDDRPANLQRVDLALLFQQDLSARGYEERERNGARPVGGEVVEDRVLVVGLPDVVGAGGALLLQELECLVLVTGRIQAER